MENAPDPIADAELIYRRVPESTGWHRPVTGLLPEAFAPTKHDTTGFSVARASYKSAEQAAKGRPGKRYFIAVLRVGTLREHGIAVVPRELPDDPGHSELPDLNAANRKDDRTLELQRVLVQLTIEVQGPFESA